MAQSPRDLTPDVLPQQDGLCFHLGDLTALRDCDACRGRVRTKVFACTHPLHVETTWQQCLDCGDREQRLGRGLVRDWAIGVTTAPREPTTLARCLKSLAATGWPEPRLFVEPGVQLPPECDHLPVTARDSPTGAWPNWYLALTELVLRQPHADAFFLVQDDVIFCRNVRRFLERVLWPAARLAVVSVYCPSVYHNQRGGFHIVDRAERLIGALTYIFPNAAARLLLAYPPALDHRRRGPADGLRNIDTVVGLWASVCRLPIYYFSPSLAQHIGDTSTVRPNDKNTGHRCASHFPGEDFDARSLIHSPA